MSKLSDAADAADAADEQAKVRKWLILLGIVVVLAVGIYFLFLRTPGERSAESLATTALTAADSPTRVLAAVELGQKLSDGESVVPNLVKLVNESKDAEVVATSVEMLHRRSHWDFPLYAAAMEHENDKVRKQGWLAIKYFYPHLTERIGFNPSDASSSREAVRVMRKRFEDGEAQASKAVAEKLAGKK